MSVKCDVISGKKGLQTWNRSHQVTNKRQRGPSYKQQSCFTHLNGNLDSTSKKHPQPMPTPPGLHPRHEDVHLTNTRRWLSWGTLFTTARKATWHKGTSRLNEHCLRHTARPHGGVWFSHKKEQSADADRHAGESWTHDATWKKPDTKGHVLRDRGHTKSPRRATAAQLCGHTKPHSTGRWERANRAVCGYTVERTATCLAVSLPHWGSAHHLKETKQGTRYESSFCPPKTHYSGGAPSK